MKIKVPVSMMLFGMALAANAANIATTTADARVRFDANISTGQTSVEVGSHGANYPVNAFRSVYVMPFEMPTLGAGESFANASLSFTVDVIDNMPVTQYADLYGLTRVDASDAAIAGDFYEGTLDGANTLLQSQILTSTSSTGANATDASGGTALTAFLNTQYGGGANAGEFVFLRLSSNEEPTGGNQRYKIFAAENGAGTVATITYDIIPEPGSALLGLLGTGIFFLRRRRN